MKAHTQYELKKQNRHIFIKCRLLLNMFISL